MNTNCISKLYKCRKYLNKKIKKKKEEENYNVTTQ